MADYQTQYRRYLRFVLATLNLSPSALAKKSKIAATTLTRFLNSTDHKFTISSTTVQKIAEASGISAGPFLDDGRSPEERAAIDHLITANEIGPNFASAIEYEINPGLWVEKDVYDTSFVPVDMGLPSLKGREDNFYALVKGDSIDAVARDGEYLYCQRVHNPDEQMLWAGMDGFIWLLERNSSDGLLVECSARYARLVSDDLELSFLSSNPKFSNFKLLVPQGDFGRTSVRVKGMVLSVVRRIAQYDQESGKVR